MLDGNTDYRRGKAPVNFGTAGSEALACRHARIPFILIIYSAVEAIVLSKIRLDSVFVFVFLLSSIEVAAGNLHVPGLGLTLCENAITLNEDSNLNSPAKQELSGWAEGYMGGLFRAWMIDYTQSLGQNPATSELTVDYESGRVWSRLIEYCQDVPTDTVADAVMATYTEAISH